MGRAQKTQLLNWENGTPYSTAVNTYNVRDQLTCVKEYSGDATGTEACPSATCQKTDLSYDGHGRLEKRYLPIYKGSTQNPSVRPYDQYEYYNDDTLKKATDPRNANKQYSYNGRGLITGITYYSPPWVQVTPNVTFSYDAAGNRTGMAEVGIGSVSYSYDTLSRLQSETRTFNDYWPPPVHTFNYQYNLAGQLKYISFPDRSVTYNRDKAGQMTSVTSTGFGQSSLMSGNTYRAWGAPKHCALNNTNFDMTYNVRLRVSSKSIGSARNTNYYYYNDARLQKILNTQDSEKNYSYEYDHAARLTNAKSGGTVTGAATPVGPYQQTFGFDTFNHLVSRDSKVWESSSIVNTTTYSNDRRPGTIYNPANYDAAGNLQDETTHFVYDDSGNKIYYSIDGNGNNCFQYDAEGRKLYSGAGFLIYDGDGKLIKKGTGAIPNTAITGWEFYFNSTALGGAAVSVYDGRSNAYAVRKRDYVYANGARIAEYFPTNPITLAFEYTDTSGKLSVGNGVVSERLYDPLGNPADRPVQGPEILSPYGVTGTGGGYQSLTCFNDGIQSDCDQVFALLKDGAVNAGPGLNNLFNQVLGGFLVLPESIDYQYSGGERSNATIQYGAKLFGGQQPKPQPAPTPLQKPTCYVSLVARKIKQLNATSSPFKGVGVNAYHLYILTKQSGGDYQQIHHGYPYSDGQLLARTFPFDSNNWDYTDTQDVGPLGSVESVASVEGSCDPIRKNFLATQQAINTADIPYTWYLDNSNAAAYTTLARYDKSLLNALEIKLFVKLGVHALALNNIPQSPPIIPGWGNNVLSR